MRVTLVSEATRRANSTAAATTPTPTPIARLCVHTVTATVSTMTTVSLTGIRRRVEGRMLCQSKVATDTTIITATSTAIGMIATTSPNARTSTSRKTPARNVEMRVRAPEAFTLIIVCPIIAQPPIPPNSPDSTFAAPWPSDSRVFDEGVSVMSSTRAAVISDSSSPTTAIATANGKMMPRVSRVNGTSGISREGRLSGRAPWSPTVGTEMPNTTAAPVSSTIATRGAGTALVTRGSRYMIRSPAAAIG